MRKAYINCNIYGRKEDAILIDEETITLVGNTEDVLKEVSESDEVIDVQNHFVLPGFIDTHMHLLELGYYLSNVVLDTCDSIESLKYKLLTRLETLKPNAWLIGRGYNETFFIGGNKPTKQLLDQISAEVPIAITRFCGHIMVVNSKALELAGITPETTIDGGKIDFDSGVIEENAIHFIHEAIPKPDAFTLQDYIFKGTRKVNEVGVTTVGSDDFLSLMKEYEPTLDAFEKLSFQESLNVRVNEQCEFANSSDFAKFLDDGYTFDVGNDLFRIGPLKLIMDGSLGGRTAALSVPYKDDPLKQGYQSMTYEEAETMIALATRFNMPTIAHAIGDATVDTVLDLFDTYVYEGNPLHHGLVHCQIMRQDQIERIIEKQYSCYIQSQFIDDDASVLYKRIDDTIAKTSYPFHTLFNGTLTSNGSDAPVVDPNPLLGIQMAVTRTSTKSNDVLNAHEAMTIDEAIASYTTQAAKQLFMDDRIGKIAPGYYADIVVLDQDITTINPQEIAKTKVLMTIMNGKTVFER